MSDTLDARCRAWEDGNETTRRGFRSVPVRKDAKAPGQVRALTSETFSGQIAPAHPFASLTR